MLSKGKVEERHYGNPDMYDSILYTSTVGLQLAELSSIPRSVVDDAKNIADLVQRQIHVIHYVVSIVDTYSFYFRKTSNSVRKHYSKEQHSNWQCSWYRLRGTHD